MSQRPLTRVELIALRDRNRDNPDFRAVLLEVKRLRALVLRSHDYFRQPPSSSTASAMAASLRDDLAVEPVVVEQPRL